MNEQMTLLDVPDQPAPKRKPVRPAEKLEAGSRRLLANSQQPTAISQQAKHEETPTAQALRFRREAAERRAELRQAQIKDELR